MSAKILIVEDNTDSRELLEIFLTTRGFQVLTAGSGSEGFYLAQATQPDVIITDLTMPNGSGLEMIKQIRATQETAHIPIAIYTAYSKSFIASALEAGANKIFSKPVNLEKLARFAAETLNHPAHQSSSNPG
ncbi:MAG: response regulator [Acidobacteria bacterium]|nr:response regulator [Acidobacteriota bacterium]